MELLGVGRRGRSALRRRGQRLAQALTVAALCAVGAAAQEPDEYPQYWSRIFDEVLPEFQAAARDRGEFEQDRLPRLYDFLLLYRAHHHQLWPDGLEFHATVEQIHAYRRAHDWPSEPYAWLDYSLSLAFEQNGRVAEVREHLERVVATYDDQPAHLPHLVHTQAQLARHCRDLASAAEHRTALGQIVDLTDTSDVGVEARLLWRFESVAYLINVGLQDEAIPHAEAARELIEEHVLRDAPAADRLWLVRDYLYVMIDLAYALDDYPRALATLEWARAQSWYSEVDEVRRRALRTRVALARLTEEQLTLDPGQPARAEVLALLDEPLAGDDRLLLLTQLASYELDLGDADAAQRHLDQAAGVLEAHTFDCGVELPSSREVDLAVLAAYAALARGQAQEMAAHLASLRATATSMLARWSAIPVRRSGAALLHTRDRMRLATVLSELHLACDPGPGGTARALEELTRFQVLGTLARELGAMAPSLSDVRRLLLPEGGGLLVFAPGALRSLVFCVDRDRISAHRLDSVFRLDGARRAMQAALDRAVRRAELDDELNHALDRLGDELLPDGVRHRIAPWRQLVVVGMEGVGYVPFELLRDTAAGSTARLGSTKAIAYVPSLPVGMAIAERPLPRDAASRRLRVFAHLEGGAAGLAFGEAEQRLLFAGLGDTPRGMHVGREATLESLLAVDPDRTLASQVIAHGVESRDAGRPFGLTLAGGVLTPDRLAGRPAAPLTALTACGAWRGALRRGDDGRHHLAGAYLLAGSRSVLISQVEIDYHASLETMAGFYRGWLREGLSPAESLRRARADDPEALFPYLIHATGVAHEAWFPAAAASDRRAIVGLIAALLLLIGLGLRWARRPRRP